MVTVFVEDEGRSLPGGDDVLLQIDEVDLLPDPAALVLGFRLREGDVAVEIGGRILEGSGP
jgi:hypothetical protein